MASIWGKSWGKAWGNAWGLASEEKKDDSGGMLAVARANIAAFTERRRLEALRVKEEKRAQAEEEKAATALAEMIQRIASEPVNSVSHAVAKGFALEKQRAAEDEAAAMAWFVMMMDDE